MARRLLQCDDTHFIVRYLCDDNLQVKTRMFFKCDSDSVTVGEEYDVQWGRPKEVDRAVVIHSGTELEMRSKLKNLLLQPTSPVVSSPRSAHSPRSPTPPRPEEPPQLKRRKTEKSQFISCSVTFDTEGPTVITLEPAENLQETAPLLSSTFLTPTRPPAILTEQNEEPAPSVSPALLTPTRHPPTSADEVTGLEAQMNTVLTNINILVDLVRNGGLQQPTTQAVNISEFNSTDSDSGSASTGIPEEFQIPDVPDSELGEILRDSRNSGKTEDSEELFRSTCTNTFDVQRIVEFAVLVEHLKRCFVCHTPLDLAKCVKERQDGLASLLYIECTNCKELTTRGIVPTGKLPILV
ncbi:uncharacterized protein LOC134236032 [Saccostrea cucullata]|uniref:uncharacterized protein LOC134236032 n=1 Tax=Saccostrea cuccullata TaxID=36930 RepID=UPI002ED183D8